MATELDFTMIAGDTQRIQITVTDSAGSPVSLVGSVIRWSMSADDTPEAAEAIQKTYGVGSPDVGIELIDAPNGIFQITIDPADTDPPFVPDRYFHEAELTEADGTRTTVMTGLIRVEDALIDP